MLALVMRAWIAPMTNALGVMLWRGRDEATRVMGRMSPVMVIVEERQSGCRRGGDDSDKRCMNESLHGPFPCKRDRSIRDLRYS
jgi:hypothetical protein